MTDVICSLCSTDSVRWTRMPCTEPQLLCSICHSLLSAGISMSDPAGYVHCSRMATNESTFTS